jgi:hypothetical protein
MIVPDVDYGVKAHLSLAFLHASMSELAEAQLVIRKHVPNPGVAPVAVDALKTQIPSVPPALHEVYVIYVEHLSFKIQVVPFDTQLPNVFAQIKVVVPPTISPQRYGLHLVVVGALSSHLHLASSPSVP